MPTIAIPPKKENSDRGECHNDQTFQLFLSGKLAWSGMELNQTVGTDAFHTIMYSSSLEIRQSKNNASSFENNAVSRHLSSKGVHRTGRQMSRGSRNVLCCEMDRDQEPKRPSFAESMMCFVRLTERSHLIAVIAVFNIHQILFNSDRRREA
jgi:hypothetical protein